MTTHQLKTHPEPFQGLLERRKPYEVRKNDRHFRVGDRLILREWFPASESYSGRTVGATISYITAAGTWGLPADVCVLGLSFDA